MTAPHHLDAVLWDVDGTIAETERDGHRVAFNLAFDALKLSWHWDEATYGRLLRIAGGRERLMHYMQERPDVPSLAEGREALARALHARKNDFYARLMNHTGIALRPGVLDLMTECRDRGVRMAIATTTSRSNLEALMGGQVGHGWADWFAATVCGEDVQRKKPDPEVFLAALRALGVAPDRAVAIEDSPAGVLAARAAKCAVLVTRSFYFQEDPVEGAIAVGPGLHTCAGWNPAVPETIADLQVNLDVIKGWFAQRPGRCAPTPRNPAHAPSELPR